MNYVLAVSCCGLNSPLWISVRDYRLTHRITGAKRKTHHHQMNQCMRQRQCANRCITFGRPQLGVDAEIARKQNNSNLHCRWRETIHIYDMYKVLSNCCTFRYIAGASVILV